jgi:preflagellin peptidase FlaK
MRAEPHSGKDTPGEREERAEGGGGLSITPLEAIAWAKIAMVLSVLIGASISDIRTRRVPDRFWIVLIGAGSVFLVIEMLLMDVRMSAFTLMSLSLPAVCLVFMVWGYPELSKAFKGSGEDLFFVIVYILLLSGAAASYLLGDRVIVGMMLYSFVFISIYFAMYTFPLLGARLIHGGADAKCMMSLAALFPWYGADLPISIGPFYEKLASIEMLQYISPVHLGVLINGAFITVMIMALLLPVRNLISGTFHPLRSWTSYWSDLDSVQDKHVWIITDGEVGKDRKQDPTPELVSLLRRKGVRRVRVTPKIPFIVSLTIGFLVQIVVGNAIFAVMFLFG